MYVHILPLVIVLCSETFMAPIFLLLTLRNCKGQIRDLFCGIMFILSVTKISSFIRRIRKIAKSDS